MCSYSHRISLCHRISHCIPTIPPFLLVRSIIFFTTNLNYPIVIVLCTLTYTYIHSIISPIVHYPSSFHIISGKYIPYPHMRKM